MFSEPSQKLVPAAAHGNRISAHFEQQGGSVIAGLDTQPIDNIQKYFICFTNRVGSNFLAELLATTGQFNIAGEIFNYDIVVKQSTNKQYSSFDEYIIKTMAHKQVNDRFVAKIGIGQLIFFESLGILDTIFKDARYILIERGDKIAQAISHEIAFQTKKWTSYHSEAIDLKDVTFDAEKIENRLSKLVENYHEFDRFFIRRAVVPTLISYETLEAAPASTVRSALRTLGVEVGKFDTRHLKTKKQRNELNEDFRRRFIETMSAAKTG